MDRLYWMHCILLKGAAISRSDSIGIIVVHYCISESLRVTHCTIPILIAKELT
jgi:hypothetical protein